MCHRGAAYFHDCRNMLDFSLGLLGRGLWWMRVDVVQLRRIDLPAMGRCVADGRLSLMPWGIRPSVAAPVFIRRMRLAALRAMWEPWVMLSLPYCRSSFRGRFRYVVCANQRNKTRCWGTVGFDLVDKSELVETRALVPMGLDTAMEACCYPTLSRCSSPMIRGCAKNTKKNINISSVFQRICAAPRLQRH
jgi:hypothetical protein